MTEPSKTPRTDAAMAVVYDRTINADCDAIRAAIEPIEVELTAARLSLSESVDTARLQTIEAGLQAKMKCDALDRAEAAEAYAELTTRKAMKVLDTCAILDCACTLRERDSGHRVGCAVPYQREALNELRAVLRRDGEARTEIQGAIIDEPNLDAMIERAFPKSESEIVHPQNPNPSGHSTAEPSVASGDCPDPGITDEDSGPGGLGPHGCHAVGQSNTPRCRAIDRKHNAMRDRLPPFPGCLEVSAIEDARNSAFVALAHTLERELSRCHSQVSKQEPTP